MILLATWVCWGVWAKLGSEEILGLEKAVEGNETGCWVGVGGGRRLGIGFTSGMGARLAGTGRVQRWRKGIS